MKITVKYKSEVLGERIFWEGNAVDIEDIRNIPARETAKMVIKDGVGSARTCGMWTVSAEDN